MTNIEYEASVEVPFNEHVIAGKALQAANGGDVGAVRQALESPHEWIDIMHTVCNYLEAEFGKGSHDLL